MSRLGRYRESLNKFIKDRSLLSDPQIPTEMYPIIYAEIKRCDLTLPILFLTMMNSQNKKKHITMQGYYAATSVLFSFALLNIIEDKERLIKQYDNECYNYLCMFFSLASNKSLCQNLEVIKNSLSVESTKIYTNIMNIYHDNINHTNILNNYKFEISDNKCNNELLKWYVYDTNNQDDFIQISQIKQESFINYINKKFGSLCEMAFTISWTLGCGDEKELIKIKKLSKYFSIMYKLSYDFSNLNDDIKNISGNNLSRNYIINYGLQDSYELFLYNKQKFIEESMTLDIFSNTVREIVNYIEKKVDDVIDKTSPDLKSNFSSCDI